MTSAMVEGCTGLVVRFTSNSPPPPSSRAQSHRPTTKNFLKQGSQILSTLLAHPSITSITAHARRTPPTADPSSKLHAIISPDTSTWAADIRALTPPPSLFLSALGTTRAQAGSLAAQRLIDYDLNLALARAAKDAGVKVYVLISSAGVSTTSLWPYGRMKAELEEAVKGLGFAHTVILKPGLLLGDRRDSRPADAAEAVLRGVARVAGMVGAVLKDFWATDADVIGRAAVSAAVRCLQEEEGGGGKEGRVWVLEQSEIIRLGRTEWKG